MICKNCNRKNRESAKFCKWCGTVLPVLKRNPLDKLVGMEEVKKQIQNIVDTFMSLRYRPETRNIRLSLNSIIIGETGTGKTLLAGILKEVFYAHKIISAPLVKLVDAVDYERFLEDWDKNIDETKGGILFIDNVQKLLPDTYSKNVNALDKLFIEMGHWNNDPVVILAGLPGGLEQFLDNNPAIRNRFKYLFRLPEYGYEDLRDMCIRQLKENYGGLQFSPGAFDKLTVQLKYELKVKDDSFGYGHLARQKAEDIFTAYLSREKNGDGVVLEEDIVGYIPPVKTLDNILGEMNEFIGMAEVKKIVREIALEIQMYRQREQRGLASGERSSYHIILTGNPGTGKTTVARKLGEIFEAIGFLDSGHVVEVDRSQMVSQYVGETPKIVDRLCDKAMGGILFVDEAYTLAPGSPDGGKDEQGLQALEKLMKRMEDDRGKFVVIAAGYKDEMENLLRANPGIRSRFNRYIEIEDYTPEELFLILCQFVRKKKYNLSAEAEERVRKAVLKIYECRDKSFANGREMRTLFEKMCTSLSERINRLPLGMQTDEALVTFEAEDIPFEDTAYTSWQEYLKELDGLVGLQSVKEEIENLVAGLNIIKQRGDKGGITGKHYVFSGNPGTGKTTVARIMANVFKALDLIPKGQLVEVDRSRLVAGYAGQTAIKTNRLVDSALGGVLFIDEAYTLCMGEEDSFGKEALDILLKRLEDDRGKFVCIVAGYTDEMHKFIDSNPGLRSRFTENIRFEDFRPDELAAIFFQLAAGKQYRLSEEVKAGVRQYFEKLYATRDKNFGNAREVRKVFEKAVAAQGKRLMKIVNTPDFNREMLHEFCLQDIVGKEEKKTLEEVMAGLDEFIGMAEVKKNIRALAQQAEFLKMRFEQGWGSIDNLALNIVLTGNPGTGKTTIARKLGEIFKTVGILPEDKVIEVDRSQMVGQYMGETPRLVNALCDRAMGGVLFVDEAYTLAMPDDSGMDKYGREAVETLMKRMEDDKGKFVLIVAGYQEEMKKFLRVNPGLESRFTHYLHIADYSIGELVEIYKGMVVHKQYRLAPGAEEVLTVKIRMLCESKKDKFGNARDIRKLFDATIQQLAGRISFCPREKLTEESFCLILPGDIAGC